MGEKYLPSLEYILPVYAMMLPLVAVTANVTMWLSGAMSLTDTLNVADAVSPTEAPWPTDGEG